MNIKNVGLCVNLAMRQATRAAHESDCDIARAISNKKNGLIPSLCFIVTKRYPKPEVLLEADLDKIMAIHEWRTYGWKPERFSEKRGTIRLCKN